MHADSVPERQLNCRAWLGRGVLLGRAHEVATARGTLKEDPMSIVTILLIVITAILVGVLPVWPHAKTWGYGPSTAAGAILAIVTVLIVLGRP